MFKKRKKAVLLVRGVPPNLKAQFKSWCAAREIPMKEQIIYLMEKTLKTNQSRPKPKKPEEVRYLGEFGDDE